MVYEVDEYSFLQKWVNDITFFSENQQTPSNNFHRRTFIEVNIWKKGGTIK